MHRSHLDPLYDVPGASKMVLQPATDNPETEDFLYEMQTSLDAEATEKLKKLKEANESGKGESEKRKRKPPRTRRGRRILCPLRFEVV